MSSVRELEAEEEALCEVLEAAEELLRAKTLLQASLKEGWFNLTRARYHMGSGSVGQLQYDHNMVASVRLSASEASEASSSAPRAWSLQRVEEPSSGSGLRRRVGESVGESGRSKRASTEGDTAEQQPRAARTGLPVAPLRWFAGALPPPPLRAAQQHFWRALECVVDAANAQARLRDLPARRASAAVLHAAQSSAETEELEGSARTGGDEVSSILEKLGIEDADVDGSPSTYSEGAAILRVALPLG